jgi:hypothetical protein
MSFRHLLRLSAAARKPRWVKLQLELLESRCVPAAANCIWKGALLGHWSDPNS